MRDALIKSSILMAYFLRHAPEAIGLNICQDGWVDIEDLATKSRNWKDTLDVETIKAVISTDDKGRYELSEDGLKVRAVQGHSTAKVDLQFKAQQPPPFLYHGTASRFLASIAEQGLLKGSRHYVHLSELIDTATNVGKRHGSPVVFSVDCLRMVADGYSFFLSENNVWLTQTVPVKYLTIL